MENTIKNKVKMKQSTAWEVNKVLSMAPGRENIQFMRAVAPNNKVNSFAFRM